MRLLAYCRFLYMVGCVAFVFLSVASKLAGQTPFLRPDTTPNYASYHHLEDCEMAILRLTDDYETRRDSIWYDTTAPQVQQFHALKIRTSRRPDTVLKAAKVCLGSFDADTVRVLSVLHARYVVEVLLMAQRDEDAHRFTERFLDSMRNEPADTLRKSLGAMTEAFGNARPIRLDEAKRYYAKWLAALKSDSLYRSVTAMLIMGDIMGRAGDTAGYKEIMWQAVRANDGLTEQQRRKAEPRVRGLVGFLEEETWKEGMDSLAVSTMAYSLYKHNVINVRVYGKEARRTKEEIKLLEVPGIVGEHYYVASLESSPDATIQGFASYTKRGSAQEAKLPSRNRVNLIVGLPGFCHTETQVRWIDQIVEQRSRPKGCVDVYARIRRIKLRFPDLVITVLSSTYGTVGVLGPLKPAQEADTIAKLFLGFHRLPVHLVVEETPFFHVAAPDNRRVDRQTPYAEVLEYDFTDRVLLITDKEGLAVDDWPNLESDKFYRMIETLMKRPGK